MYQQNHKEHDTLKNRHIAISFTPHHPNYIIKTLLYTTDVFEEKGALSLQCYHRAYIVAKLVSITARSDLLSAWCRTDHLSHYVFILVSAILA